MSFAGIRPVVHTPFEETEGLPVAFGELSRLIEKLRTLPIDGFVALGLASESWELTERERDQIVAIVVEGAGDLPVTVGIDGATAIAVNRAWRAAEAGASGLMVLPPPRSTLSSRTKHFADLSKVGLPLLIQDSPQVTGVSLESTEIANLVTELAMVHGVKVEAPGAEHKVSRLAEDGVPVVAGWGGLNFYEGLHRGACGLMPGCDTAAAFTAMQMRWTRGDHDGALDLYRALVPYLSYQSQSLELLILAAKRVLVDAKVFSTTRLRNPDGRLDGIQERSLERYFGSVEEAGPQDWKSE
jgi:dihydrodipicolinate synthase/N-acetylneuraminate lyase